MTSYGKANELTWHRTAEKKMANEISEAKVRSQEELAKRRRYGIFLKLNRKMKSNQNEKRINLIAKSFEETLFTKTGHRCKESFHLLSHIYVSNSTPALFMSTVRAFITYGLHTELISYTLVLS